MKLTRKSIGRIAASFVATAMLATMAIVPASAANMSGAVVDITKQITKDENAYAPNTSFTFQVKPYAGDTEDGAVVQAGPEGGVYFSMNEGAKVYTGTISSAPNGNDIGQTTLTLAQKLGLQIDETVLLAKDPGVYRYEVSEVTPENGYDGITYTTEVKYFDVYVTTNSAGEKEISAYTFVDADGDSKDDGIFVNDYSNEITGANKTLRVEKVLAGDQASPNQEFEIDITINGASGEQYKIVKTNTAGAEETMTVTYLTSGQLQTIELQGDEYVTIYGLSPKDTYTVVEHDYTGLNYTATYKVDNTDANNVNNQTISDNNDVVTITNTRNASTPTGIMMDIAPYAVLVVIAAAGCFIFLRKRHAKED